LPENNRRGNAPKGFFAKWCCKNGTHVARMAKYICAEALQVCKIDFLLEARLRKKNYFCGENNVKIILL
jgi:hypothetical protein